MKILIVEDEPSLRELMYKTLLQERYVVETAGTYLEASLKITDYSYDCILLDIMLPDGNGLKLLDDLKKQHKQESVIIISAKDSIDDKVSGLELGADDYLPKPFHLAELNARIKSVMRRRWGNGDMSIQLGNIRIEPDSFRVFIAGKEIELLKKEYDILLYFMNRPNHLIDKAALAEAVWGDHIDQSDNFYFVYAQVKNLRQQLKKAGADVEIRSIYGFGYKIVICNNESTGKQ
ncbi:MULTISPECIES: response regulator transcription factor [Parabacteroides]|uniref:DNA-binding response regulator, OmpR family, contains REC and winged-helix (WHTH) domain n=1 Tax=Parabacteroides chinchillae TaxID=871327 RepID=A0A8G2BX25_9BACT|nr:MULTISPECIES: response regulator transcription factor [Parabacteroides]SEF98458.1 DNA-binding response regulator, OmpR family, contains REC and winged-helix (wHTH) domain [Parabacteroides chinchillae]